MKLSKTVIGFAMTALLLAGCEQGAQNGSVDQLAYPASEAVMIDMERVANWQIPRLGRLDYIVSQRRHRRNSEKPLTWIQGAFYSGLSALAERSTNPTYEEWIGFNANKWEWQLLHKRPFHADDHVIGQTYIWYYKRHGNEEALADIKNIFDMILDNQPTVSLEFDNDKRECQLRWCWSDALFMSPATWFGLADVTGEQRYADYAHKEFKATVDFLYDPEFSLLYRDSRYKGRLGDFGEQIFWSRGSGWVFAGLANSMNIIPKDHPQRGFYEKLFREMAAKLKSLQKKDGTWAMSLLAKENIKEPETSGTGFFTYGLAWGINNGLLDEEEYWPTVAKGWTALTDAVHPDGRLGWVQPIGAAPGETSYEKSQLYGVGAYLLAGSAIYDMMVEREPKEIIAYGRFVPERQDDFTWENDKVAFRVYGPASPLEGQSNGVDAWFKKVDYPVIDKWYANFLKGITYHEDHGEGYDPYHVGTSRGVGGSAIWVDGVPYTAHNFLSYDIKESGGDKVVFALEYEWNTPLGQVAESRTISLALGDQLYSADSVFTLDGVPASLPIAIGLTTHDGAAAVAFNKVRGRISAWETIDGLGVGTGVLIEPARVENIEHIPSEMKDQSHIWLFTSSDDEGKLAYRAGFAWEAAGEITTSQQWDGYLDAR